MGTADRTRILIVDDSAVVRSILRSVVSSDSALEVAGTAADGASLLSILESARPNLILLDVEMPVMDGLHTLRQLRSRGCKVPVIMCSSLTQRGAKVTLEALASGASDYVTKPVAQATREAALRTLSQDLLPRIHALTDTVAASPSLLPTSAPRGTLVPFITAPQPQVTRAVPDAFSPSVVVIGVSTGGPAALDVLLPTLPANFLLPVLIVQHMPEVFTRLFAERLDTKCKLRAHEAVDGEPVRAGHIYVARGNWHMEVMSAVRPVAGPSLRLTQGPLENHCRPAVDVLFRTAANVYGSRVLGVVLTGMGSDGLAGSRIICNQGGVVLAQDRASSTVWGMPGSVTNAGLAQSVLPLQAIGAEILRLAVPAARQTAERIQLIG